MITKLTFTALAVLSSIASAAPAEKKMCQSLRSYNYALATGLTGADAQKASMIPCEQKEVDIKAYDCRAGTVSANKGKCLITVTLDSGAEQTYRASPEVAATWGNSYGEANCRPMTDLKMIINRGEILSVYDFKGERISAKYDLTR